MTNTPPPCWAGAAILRGDQKEGLAAAALGDPPFRYDVTLRLDGAEYRATANWPQDVDPECSPCVPLQFSPGAPRSCPIRRSRVRWRAPEISCNLDEETGRLGAWSTVDEIGFEPWYVREHPKLVSALTVVAGNPAVAAEAADEAFAARYERWGRVGVMASPGGWTYRTALNVVRRRWRRAALEARILHRKPRFEAPADWSTEVWDALQRLPPRERTAIALRYVADLTTEEIAAAMHVAPGHRRFHAQRGAPQLARRARRRPGVGWPYRRDERGGGRCPVLTTHSVRSRVSPSIRRRPHRRSSNSRARTRARHVRRRVIGGSLAAIVLVAAGIGVMVVTRDRESVRATEPGPPLVTVTTAPAAGFDATADPAEDLEDGDRSRSSSLRPRSVAAQCAAEAVAPDADEAQWCDLNVRPDPETGGNVLSFQVSRVIETANGLIDCAEAPSPVRPRRVPRWLGRTADVGRDLVPHRPGTGSRGRDLVVEHRRRRMATPSASRGEGFRPGEDVFVTQCNGPDDVSAT